MFNINSINLKQSKPFPRDPKEIGNAYMKPSQIKLSKLEDKEESAFESGKSQISQHRKNNISASQNFLLNNNSFKQEKTFDVSNLNFNAVSKKSDESIMSKSPTDRMSRFNKSSDTRSNLSNSKNFSYTPNNLGVRGFINRSSDNQSDDTDKFDKKAEYSLAENLSDVKIHKNIVKNLETELQEKNEEINILKKNFREKINNLEIENKKILDNIEKENKVCTEKINQNFENLKIELNYQTSQKNFQSEETLNRLMADLKMTKNNNISIHVYNSKLSEISNNWSENFSRLKKSYEKSMTENFQLHERNEYKELIERMKFLDKYKDKIKLQLQKEIEKNKFLLTSEEALNDIIMLKLLEVESSHLKEYSEMQIEFERSLNENCYKYKEKLSKIKEFAIKRFREVENISIFTKDNFINVEDFITKGSNLTEARFSPTNINCPNQNLNNDNIYANSIREKEFVRFNSGMLKINASVDKLTKKDLYVLSGIYN